jgi:drug/metabolite transporter (DMT)-like permease
MPINIEGGLRRLVTALRVLGRVWGWGALICFALYVALSGEFQSTRASDLIQAVLFVLVLAGMPAGILIGLAWLLEGLIEPKR